MPPSACPKHTLSFMQCMLQQVTQEHFACLDGRAPGVQGMACVSCAADCPWSGWPELQQPCELTLGPEATQAECEQSPMVAGASSSCLGSSARCACPGTAWCRSAVLSNVRAPVQANLGQPFPLCTSAHARGLPLAALGLHWCPRNEQFVAAAERAGVGACLVSGREAQEGRVGQKLDSIMMLQDWG